MQHKGVSCGPLSFIHAAAACELPAWQSCRRVLLHPVDSCSHSSIRGPQSRAGAHLHKKYMDTFLPYVTVTTNLFLPWLWKPSYFKQANTTTPHTQSHCGVFHLRLLYHVYLWSADVCLCWQHGVIGVYIVHYVAPVVPCSIPTHPFWLLSRKQPHCTKARTSHCCPRSLRPASLQIRTNPHLPVGYVVKVQKWRSRAEVTNPVHFTASPHNPSVPLAREPVSEVVDNVDKAMILSQFSI